MTAALRLSLSQAYTLRWSPITYNPSGSNADPRALFIPQFQLVAPDATSFGTSWTNGTWDSDVPGGGPFGATITVGAGQPVPVNPGKAGTYMMVGRLYQAVGETPTFNIRAVILEAP
jgi:hypothetical protein